MTARTELTSPEQEIGTRGERKAVRESALVALCAVAMAWIWLLLATHYLYGGNWTSVYYTGAKMPVPEELASEHIYQFPNAVGYDGQAYHIIAHDPLFHQGMARVMDMPRVRYRRILVPGLAALVSFGNSTWVDPAFLLVVSGFLYLGTFWLARWSTSHGHSALWGFLFLIAPAALSSILLMVVDVSLAALTVGVVWYAEQNSKMKLFAVLACAPLARETGILVIVGYCGWLLLSNTRKTVAVSSVPRKEQRVSFPFSGHASVPFALFKKQLAQASLFATAALPVLLWWLFVQMHTEPKGPIWISPIPFLGIYDNLMNNTPYRPGLTGYLLLALDRVALAGMLLALGMVLFYAVRPRLWSLAIFIAGAFALLGIFLGGGEVWMEVLNFGRVFTPLLLMIAMVGILRRNWWPVVPIFLVLPRIASIYAIHAARMVQSAMHHV